MPGVNVTPDGVEVTFMVEEMSCVGGGIHTAVGNNEGSVVIIQPYINIIRST